MDELESHEKQVQPPSNVPTKRSKNLVNKHSQKYPDSRSDTKTYVINHRGYQKEQIVTQDLKNDFSASNQIIQGCNLSVSSLHNSGKKLEIESKENLKKREEQFVSLIFGREVIQEKFEYQSNQQIPKQNMRQIFLQLPRKKIISIQFDENDENILTCGWLLSESIRKITSFLIENPEVKEDVNSIVALKSSDKNFAVDFYLSQFHQPLNKLKNDSILIPYYSNSIYKFQEGEKITLQHFHILIKIGSGGFSQVYLARRKDTGQFVVLKVINKKNIIQRKKKMYIYNEKNIMMALQDSPFVVKLYFSFQTLNKLVFVIEYCPGGELFYNLEQVKQLNEDDARIYFGEILTGIEHLHEKKVLYRDLKPENILLDIEGHLKFTDFGLSSFKQRENKLNYTFCGTFEYMCPEMLLQKGHSYEADFFALGAVLYKMVAGFPPFEYDESVNIMEQAPNDKVVFPENFSNELKDLISQLLIKDPKKRLGSSAGINQIKSHKWCSLIDFNIIRSGHAAMPIKPSLEYLNFDKDFIVHEKSLDSLLEESTPQEEYDENDGISDLSIESIQSFKNGTHPSSLLLEQETESIVNLMKNDIILEDKRQQSSNFITKAQNINYNNNQSSIKCNNQEESASLNDLINIHHFNFDHLNPRGEYDFLDFSFNENSSSAAAEFKFLHLQHEQNMSEGNSKKLQLIENDDDDNPTIFLFFENFQNTHSEEASKNINYLSKKEIYESIKKEKFGPKLTKYNLKNFYKDDPALDDSRETALKNKNHDLLSHQIQSCEDNEHLNQEIKNKIGLSVASEGCLDNFVQIFSIKARNINF